MKVKTQAAGAVALADIDAVPRLAPRWGRYALWQFGDYARAAGLGTLVVATGAVALLANAMSPRIPGRELAVGELLVQVGFLGSIFAVTGLIATDRTRGWYRFMFAKPASPLRYYAQAFALRGLGLLTVTTIAWALCSIFVTPVSLFRVLDATVLQFTLIGSVTLLLSTLIRFDWLAALVISVISWIISDVARSATAPWWSKLLHWVLPPLGPMTNITHAIFQAIAPWLPYGAIPSVLWVVGYGAAAFAAAMVILKRREWAR